MARMLPGATGATIGRRLQRVFGVLVSLLLLSGAASVLSLIVVNGQVDRLVNHATSLRARADTITSISRIITGSALGLLVIALLGIGLAVVLARRTTSAVTRPLEHLRATLERLFAGDQSARAVPEGPTEIVVLAQALNAMADANLLLSAEQQEHLRIERLSRELSQKIRMHLDVGEVVDAAVASLGAQFEVDRVYIRLSDDHGSARVAGEWTRPGVMAASNVVDLPASSRAVLANMAASRKVLVVNDVSSDAVDSQVKEAMGIYEADAAIACGLTAGSDTFGLLVIQVVGSPRVWTTTEITIVETVAREISVAINHARAYDVERDAVARLQELDDAKTAFLSSVSHELRTPLTSIMGYLEMLTDGEAGELTPEQLNMVKIVERNGGRLLTLIEDLLTLSRVEAGSFRLLLGDVVVGDMLQSVADSMAPLAAASNVTLSMDVPDGVGTIAADPDQLERAVLNLVSNAVKFTPAGGWVTISVGRRDDMIRLRVRDTGIGIPLAEQDKLFTRFFRSSISQQQAVQGTGLGLSIVKNVVEQHGGSIEIESAPGEGTTVTVLLPANGKPAPLTMQGALV